VTPVAAAAADETPVVGVVMALDFAFKYPWLARVTQGFSRENIVDLAMSTQTAYTRPLTAALGLREYFYRQYRAGTQRWPSTTSTAPCKCWII
jgi:hypothetical protein